MHVGFNCPVECCLYGSGVGLGMCSGTASRQVVCMVVYRMWCGCRECATCVLSTVSHITCWLPFVLCVLDLIVVPCASCFVYLQQCINHLLVCHSDYNEMCVYKIMLLGPDGLSLGTD